MKDPLQNGFLRTLLLLVVLNILVKPVWIFAIDRQVQNLTGFASYGSYYAMMSFCFLFSMVLDPGLHVRLSREAASSSDRLPTILSEAVRVKFLLVLSFWVVLLSAAYATGIDDWATLLPVGLLFTCASSLSMVRHFMSGAQMFRQDAWLSVADKSLVVLTIGPLLLLPQAGGLVTVRAFIWVQVVSLLLALAAGMVMVVRHIGPLAIGSVRRMDLSAFGSGFPFAVNSFLMGMVSWSDGFLLGRMHPSGTEEAGVYAAGYRLLDAFGMLGTIVGGSMLSYISGLWAGRGDYQPAFTATRKVLMLAAVLVSTCMSACPLYFSNLLYHRAQGPLVGVMGTLMLALPALYIVHMQGTLLTATGHISTFIRISLAAALASFLLKLAFLPDFGARASAWICMGVYWAYAVALVFGTHRRLSSGIGSSEALLYAMSALGCYGLLRFLLYFGWQTPVALACASLVSAYVFARVGGVAMRDIWDVLKGK
jgi:O-antigen/teichoic acid export membrane protein